VPGAWWVPGPHTHPTPPHAACPPAEDRICGTIDIEKALTEGIKAYEPGLLARANRGILYVDEVNLLDDGLVDVVLDSGGCCSTSCLVVWVLAVFWCAGCCAFFWCAGC